MFLEQAVVRENSVHEFIWCGSCELQRSAHIQCLNNAKLTIDLVSRDAGRIARKTKCRVC